jgi:hypothetical protein
VQPGSRRTARLMPQHACSLQINTQQAGGGARTSLMTRSGSAQAWASMAAATTARRNVRLGMVCVASSTLPQSRVECRNIYNQRETTERTERALEVAFCKTVRLVTTVRAKRWSFGISIYLSTVPMGHVLGFEFGQD